ncbi:S-adenosyl-L-methionine-dependent methyltransferases superfamily protein [Euphorbia peplus]|nr:S-adenosyl-L-methionine-dependent methyltransferases superfamily protein [Euphorbia peplus]
MRSLSLCWYLSRATLLSSPAKNIFSVAANLSMDNKLSTLKDQFNPQLNTMQLIVNANPSDGWERSWEQGLTPWDLGKPTPILLHLHRTGHLPKGRALIPGCGSGYDVVAIASPERHVTGLDISEKAIEKAEELSSSLSNANYFTFLKADFFSWSPPQLFDLIFDYTFFCAIEPEMRIEWALRIQDLLKPDGELITLIFPIDDHVGGPPYKVSVSDYEKVLCPIGFKIVSLVDNELAVSARKGREMLGRWKRPLTQSSL